MPTSIQKLTTCHNNARRSTGPRTEAGKQNSSRNSLKHGLSAQTTPCAARERLTDQIDRHDRCRSYYQKDYRATLKLLRNLHIDRAVLAQQDSAVSILTNSYPLARFSHLTKRTDRILACDLTVVVERNVTDFLKQQDVDVTSD